MKRAETVDRVPVRRSAFARSSSDDSRETVRELEHEIGQLRDRLFDLVDAARINLPHHRGEVHVHLLAAANELGAAERTLDRGSGS